VLIVGNWKMNGSLAANARLLDALAAASDIPCALGVCAPHVYLRDCAARLEGSAVAVGAQDLSQHDAGAHTGEVSAAMLADVGCCYVIVGHSERRTSHRENDVLIGVKLRRAWQAGLIPILCIGETLAEYQAGETQAVLRTQLRGALAAAMEDGAAAELVVAYEPVWAIGTGLSAAPEEVRVVHQFLRDELEQLLPRHVPLLYGGSVKPANAAALFALPNVDGGLVGGAALNAHDFLAIARAAKRSSA
jgi:triosephosphate isomerase